MAETLDPQEIPVIPSVDSETVFSNIGDSYGKLGQMAALGYDATPAFTVFEGVTGALDEGTDVIMSLPTGDPVGDPLDPDPDPPPPPRPTTRPSSTTSVSSG